MTDSIQPIDIAIIGAGASGLFCAAHLAQAGLQVTLFDNGKRPARKVMISGGGRCNFTQLNASADNYLSQNSHFCKSALARYRPWDFLTLVNRYAIAYHEKKAGQLFCDKSAKSIVDMLITECQKGAVQFNLSYDVEYVTRQEDGKFILQGSGKTYQANQLVVASGGLSMPALGASAIGYKIAQHFGLSIIATRAGLVPLTLHKPLLASLQTLAGISLPVTVSSGIQQFSDDLLFTHRGLSGPAILQLSNYWHPGEAITINLLPHLDVVDFLQTARQQQGAQRIKTSLAKRLPKRLVEWLQSCAIIPDYSLKQLNNQQINEIAYALSHWQIQPNGTEGYRTAEVTIGGIDTQELSSKTMECHRQPGLYFIGEIIDVTGQLGGYNFQWAWSSARACSTAIIAKLSAV